MEYDVSDIAWKTYRVMYKDSLLKEAKIMDNSRKHACATYGNCVGKLSINLSGDLDFNFHQGFAHSRLEKYKKLLDDDPNDPNVPDAKNNLEILEELTRSIVNISLMPQCGNLQSVKQGIGNDRMDTFIWALSEYYNKNSNLLFNHSSYENLQVLKAYLSSFHGVYHYCTVVYHIDESLVKGMVESGKLAIDSPKRVMRFMNLAIRFWKQKWEFLDEKLREENMHELTEELQKCRGLINRYRLYDNKEN